MNQKALKPSETSTGRFLQGLFPEVPAECRILLWELKGKISRWFPDIESASMFAANKTDLYVGCGLAPKAFGDRGRCPADQIYSINGLWVDIDYKSAHHKKKNLPPTLEAAVKLATALMKPSMIIFTGHGIQAWWLFREPWVFDSPEDRKKGGLLVQRWQDAIRRQALKKKWEVDATHDLARIFRMPGTFNGKGRKPKECEFINESPDVVYNESDFETFFEEPELFEQNSKETKPSGASSKEKTSTTTSPSVRSFSLAELPDVKIRKTRGPNPEKWYALQHVDPKIKSTFDRTRKDMKDTSPSAIDMALSNYALQAGWKDQEICDLLVAHRLKHDPHDPKLERPRYFALTIAKARETSTVETAFEEMEELVDFGTIDGQEPTPDEKRSKHLLHLQKILKVPIIRVVRFLADPPQYRLEMQDGKHISLGLVEGLIEQRKFRNAVASITGVLINPQSKSLWQKTAQTALDACEDVDPGKESTEASVGLWLLQYFGEQVPLEADQSEEILSTQFPFERLNRGKIEICFHLADFSKWLRVVFNERRSQRQLSVLLRGFGLKPKTVRIKGNKKQLWVWTVNMDFLEEQCAGDVIHDEEEGTCGQ